MREKLRIGYSNGKQLLNAWNSLEFAKAEVEEVMEEGIKKDRSGRQNSYKSD